MRRLGMGGQKGEAINLAAQKGSNGTVNSQAGAHEVVKTADLGATAQFVGEKRGV